ncbi:MAG TPA: Glu/Leu/Phe/Val dehydrogenase dimerization domain-containing protein [Acidimicrobiales bacterium]|nr:Glu/Leu/Phe/Val dehydrogenase dimerization domain-containing protein [Acidimicrobiales bacterium]
MKVFDRIRGEGYEQVVFCQHTASGLRAIVAVHSTTLGPALGGTRFYPYPDEDAALEDVLRLARGMTYKAAVAGLDLGGGKAVIIGDPSTDKSEELLRAYARFVGSLGGRYVTAEDVGTTQADMDLIRRETRHVTGVSVELGGSGDPSAATAYGVLWAMRAVGQRLWGDTSLTGRRVVVSGVGKVGSALVGHLVEEKAQVVVADVVPAAVERLVHAYGVEPAPVEEAHAIPCDLFSPCALGAVLNPVTIPQLRCSGVVGSANNQLADPSCGKLLAEAGVLYGPDYVVNAGGLINIAEELSPHGYHPERARAAVARIFETTGMVLDTAETEGITTAEAADRVAERRIDELARVRQIRTFG